MNRTLPTATLLLLLAAGLAPAPASALPGEGCQDTLTYDYLSCLVDYTIEHTEGQAHAFVRFGHVGGDLACTFNGQPASAGSVFVVPTHPIEGLVDTDAYCTPTTGGALAAEAARQCVEVGVSARASGRASASATSACQSIAASCNVSTNNANVACTAVARGRSPDPWRCSLRASVSSGSASASCWVKYG